MTSQKPRLLYVVHAYNNRAGTEEHTKTLAAGLSEHFDTAVVFPEGGTVQLAEKGKITLKLPGDPPAWPITPYRMVKTEKAMFDVLAHFKPDIVHVQHFIYWPLGILDQLSEFGAPIAISYHDYYPVTPHFTMQGVRDATDCLSAEYAEKIFREDISHYLNKRRSVIQNSLAKIKYHITPSEFLAEELAKVFELNFKIIPHGIKSFTPIEKKPSDGGLRFGFTGSLLPQKGWSDLLMAFQMLRETHSDAELLFYGGGQRPQDTKLEGISFFDAYTQEDLPEILSTFDVGVIPSVFKETYNLTLSEMRLAGLPVAAANIGALGPRITNGADGQLFTPGDVRDIHRVLTWFAENDEWREWEIPTPRLLDAMLDDYRSFYEKLLSEREKS